MAVTNTATKPTTTPDIMRKFQFTVVVGGNNNKFWNASFWQAQGIAHFEWGRVGQTGQSVTKSMSLHEFEKKVAGQIKDGYNEIVLASTSDIKVVTPQLPATTTPSTVPVARVDPQVLAFVKMLFNQSAAKINTYLNTTVDALSPAHLNSARDILGRFQKTWAANAKDQNLPYIMQEFYNKIPTQLPARPNLDSLVATFVSQLNSGDLEQRLDQLEAALATMTTDQPAAVKTTDPDVARYLALGTKMAALPQSHSLYGQIVDLVTKRSKSNYQRKIKAIYLTRIGDESDKFAGYINNTWGGDLSQANVVPMFHGTATGNGQHILRSGLIVPKVAANGRRFGDGIYGAVDVDKSYNYTQSSGYGNRIMFLTDFALGKPKKLDGVDSSLKVAPNGYHSVWGTKSYGGFDEFIVYNKSQQRITAVIVFD